MRGKRCYIYTHFFAVANSPIHRVYRRYTKFHWTQNIDEMCFFAKESIKILNVSPTNQLKKCQTTLLSYSNVSSSLTWQSLAILCGESLALHAHFSTARNSDMHATIVLQWVFTSGARGECSFEQSAGTAKYCGELSFLSITRSEFC